MAVALGRMRLAPAVFWSMTMPELHAVFASLDCDAASPSLARGDLDALMQRFPDQA
jgi:uncharacterized phage protein (TIGR02216 family)